MLINGERFGLTLSKSNIRESHLWDDPPGKEQYYQVKEHWWHRGWPVVLPSVPFGLSLGLFLESATLAPVGLVA